MKHLLTGVMCAGLALLVGACNGGVIVFVSAGTYEADVPCTLMATNTEGEEQLSFEQPITLRLEIDGGIIINDVEIVVGAEVVRSIPTADLSLEVVAVEQTADAITITYEPRPTLTGITMSGELIETYTRLPAGGTVLATASADLTLTDVEQTVMFAVECESVLTRGAQD